jgi:protein-S-isoprenylcysteine O-methyltransferase Ste14
MSAAPEEMSADVYKARHSRIEPPIYVGVSVAAMFVLAVFLPLVRLLTPPVTWAGVPIALFGATMTVTAANQFRRSGTGLRPGSKATLVVRTGWYKLTRNPMYLGMSLLLLGIALCLGTLGPLLVVPVFVVMIRTRFIAKEERWMEEAFGEEYRAYQREVRRWL